MIGNFNTYNVKSIEEWDLFFASDEVYETPRNTEEFRKIENSYKLAKDGKHYFFEVILVDKDKPEIKNDKTMNWICNPKNKKRALRGLTSAGKKSRGLRKKSPTSKSRPSQRAHKRQGK